MEVSGSVQKKVIWILDFFCLVGGKMVQNEGVLLIFTISLIWMPHKAKKEKTHGPHTLKFIKTSYQDIVISSIVVSDSSSFLSFSPILRRKPNTNFLTWQQISSPLLSSETSIFFPEEKTMEFTFQSQKTHFPGTFLWNKQTKTKERKSPCSRA